MSDPQTTAPAGLALARVEAAARIIRAELLQRLGISTGREMSEEIAGLAIAAADETTY